MRMIRTGVYAKPDENINQLLRRFKKVTGESGKLEDFKDGLFYTKPTTKRKQEAGAAKSRNRKRVEKDSLPPKKR